jgi:hypothetical protein
VAVERTFRAEALVSTLKSQAFEGYVQAYESWFEKHSFVYLSELGAIRHFIPSDKRGIEIGVGTGRFAMPCGIREGVEPSGCMRKLATKRGLRVYAGVAEALPLAAQSFDFALMVR